MKRNLKKKNKTNPIEQADYHKAYKDGYEVGFQHNARVSATQPVNVAANLEQLQKSARDFAAGADFGRKESLEQFHTGAVRRKVENISRTDLIPLEALLALGERYYYGATVRGYGERNWEKGINYSNLLQHVQVHLQKLCHQIISPQSHPSNDHDDTPRENAAAIMWGMAAIIHFLAFGNPAEQGSK